MRKSAILMSIAILAGTLAARADWPQFMGPTGDGIAPDSEKIIKKFPEGGPKELWKVALKKGSSVPAIKDGKVYILDRPGNGATEKVSALDLETGKELWSIEAESTQAKTDYGITRGTPCIDGDMLYTMGVMGDLLAIDVKEKKIVWRKNIVKDFGAKAGGWGFAMSPIVLRDNLIVDTAGSAKSGVVALNKKTGEVVWSSPTIGAADTYTTPVVATIEGVEQLVTWHKGTVAGVSTKDGKILWDFKWRTDRPIPNPVVLPGGKIFCTIGYGGGCSLLQLKKTGETFSVEALFQGDDRNLSKISPPIFYKGYIYVNSSDRDQGLQCIDPDGKVKWVSTKKFGLGSTIIVDGVILQMGGKDGSITMVEANPEKYVELATAKILNPPDVWAPIAVVNGKMVVRDQEQMKCFDIGAK